MEKKPVHKREEKEVKNKKEMKKEIKKENKNKKKKKGILGKILLMLIIILLALAIGIAYKTKQNGGGLQGLLTTLVGHDEETLKNLKPIQVLLMGVSTDNGGKLTDTIIIATYDPQQQKASLLSIPRDTFIGKNPKKGTGSDKINVLYQKGPEKTLAEINELTGLDLKYYMVIDNQALIELVDLIGGVEFYVPINMNYDDSSQNLHIHLKEGLQTLDGDKAEQLLRFRKNNNNTTYPQEYGKDDYGRMRTQREFIVATVKQTIKAENILKIKGMIDLAYEYVETNLSVGVIKDYVPYAVNMDISAIRSEYLPGGSYGPPTYPLWFFIADEKQTAELIDELYGKEEEVIEVDGTEVETTTQDETKVETEVENETTITTTVEKTEAAKIKIELVNGTNSKKALTEVQKKLKDKGYKITKTTTTINASTPKTTIINKTDVDSKFTDNIKELLGIGNVSSNSVSSSAVDITIIIGNDYIK